MPVWLAQIFPALTGLIGVLLGVWLTQRGSERVTKQTLEGQMTLARDAALRDYRKQQVAPYIEVTRQRFRIWHEVRDGMKDVKKWPMSKWLELRDQLSDLGYKTLIATVAEIPDDAFEDAFYSFVDAEISLDPADPTSVTVEEIMDVTKRMRTALSDLSTAAQHYIFAREKL